MGTGRFVLFDLDPVGRNRRVVNPAGSDHDINAPGSRFFFSFFRWPFSLGSSLLFPIREQAGKEKNYGDRE